MKKLPGLLSFLLIFLFSCSDDMDSISGAWLAESMDSGDLGCSEELLEPYLLDIDERSKTYNLQLDVNGCSGVIGRVKNGEIDFDPGACTEACCDSSGAQCLLQVLTEVDRYELMDDHLILYNATAEIVFERQG